MGFAVNIVFRKGDLVTEHAGNGPLLILGMKPRDRVGERDWDEFHLWCLKTQSVVIRERHYMQNYYHIIQSVEEIPCVAHEL